MKYLKIVIAAILTSLLLAAGGCATDMPDLPEGGDAVHGSGTILLSVTFGEDVSAAFANETRAGSAFDNFDNELDKWGIPGENMESLRVIIVDGDGVVEHNEHYTLDNAEQAGYYKYGVKDNDTKTIILLANEEEYSLDAEGMEIAGGVTSMKAYFSRLSAGAKMDLSAIRALTVALRHNSLGGRGLSMKTPLPITAIYTENIPENAGEIRKEYLLHRAAVKYSFRVVNKSRFNHSLEKLRIDRIADREYLLPDADFGVNEHGHTVMTDYRTPATAGEQKYAYTFGTPLKLPAKMEEAVEAIPPVYVPEGIKNDTPQKISINLDGEELDIWKELQWHMPGESDDVKRPMCDLPRNTHVVVNITINDKDVSFEADVQPYAGVAYDAYFGLDRDEQGNIVINRYEDGTYDVLDKDGKKITRDQDGDRIIKRFKDGSILCEEIVYKDYIHDKTEVDYTYVFEKDAPGGNMVIIRKETTGGTYYEEDVPAGDSHEHGVDDRPLFVLDKAGDFHMVVYDENDKPSLSRTDVHGDTIVQANGYQFREDRTMPLGTYIVVLKDGTEELRWYKDGSVRPWPEADETRSASRLKMPKRYQWRNRR